jgi:hypothetical protein
MNNCKLKELKELKELKADQAGHKYKADLYPYP